MNQEKHTYTIKHSPGFRKRRGLNWVALGLMYASYYMCRYNFRFATPGMEDEFGFSHFQIASIFGVWSLAYGTGQLVNGLIADRIGGKKSMLIGAVGTIIINFIYGFSSFVGTFSTFALIWLINGYIQSYGAPGMVKINAAWFHRQERGTFAGIFGGMIQLGQLTINNLAPILLAGISIGFFVIGEGEWRWLFRIPPLFTAAAAIFMAYAVKETPDEAGFPGEIPDEIDNSAGVTVKIRDSFKTIFTHPLVWYYAIAYGCTGAVRHSSDQLATLYFVDELGFDLEHNIPGVVVLTFSLMGLVGFLGSLGSGIISDKFFKGHRAPVAMTLYFVEAIIITIAALTVLSGKIGPTPMGIFLGCMFLVLTSLTVNSTHSIVGAAAPMDIGGKKMAGFASGVIDSFQYYGAAIALPVTGYAVDWCGRTFGEQNQWNIWYPIMATFGLVGGLSMMMLSRKRKRLKAEGRHVFG